MSMTWGDIKAKVEAAGVKDDQEVSDISIWDTDTCVKVCNDDGSVSIEGHSHEHEGGDDELGDDSVGGCNLDEEEVKTDILPAVCPGPQK